MRRLTIALTGCLLASACQSKPVSEWHEQGTHRWRSLDVARSGKTGFRLMTKSKTGIDFTNAVDIEQALANRHLVHGSGVALGDIDGDGLVDIYLAHIHGAGRVYRNKGGMRFEDITAQSGIAMDSQHQTGAVFADVDGDGDLDLFRTALGASNKLFLNDGHGVFSDGTARSNLASTRASTTATFGDVDGDGDLDLYVATYKVRTALDMYTPQERAFDQVVRQRGDRYEIADRFRDQYRVVVRPELNIVALVQRADPDLFYLNDGTGRFTPEPLTAGRFRDEAGNVITAEPEDFGLAARFHDVDNDGDPDLYVCNDFEDPDQFWINDGTGHFRAIGRLGIRATSNSCMSVDFSDIDRDGDVDIFTADMLSRDSRRLKTQTPTHTALPKVIGDIENRPQMQRNSLFRNRGDGTFAEVASLAGVEASNWSWGSMFLDVDLDGYEDLLIGTGHRWDLMDSDTWDRIRTTVTGADWRRELTLFPPLSLPNVAFRNNGDLTFTDIGKEWGFATDTGITHGIASGDLDGDGDADVVTNRLGSSAQVLRNDGVAPRLRVSLIGQSPNRFGIGSSIRVVGDSLPAQTKEVSAGGLYLSSSAPSYTFAAGASGTLTITVDWRGGRRSIIRNAIPNRHYEIREPPDSAAAPERRPPVSVAPFFADVSAMLSHRHEDAPFDEFSRQPLLPWRFSQLGPGMTWYDVDGDRDEDLIVPSGRGGRVSVFRNDAGVLRRSASQGMVALHDLTTVLGFPVGVSGARLLAGQSSYETQTPSEALATASVIDMLVGASQAGGPGRSAVVPGDTSSSGPLTAADYDGDGDLDLFVGGRIVPGAYPLAASSRLFRNDRGTFALDTLNATTMRGIGLVSAATFSDLDDDGDPDLVLAVEWGPVKVLINTTGKFIDRTEPLGLGALRSRWNGVATGDLDGDGRLDIVATSWGRNIRHRPEKGQPLYVYYGNFGAGNTIDLVEAQNDDRIGGIAPLQTLSRLGAAIPGLRRKARTFRHYADMTIDELLGAGTARLEVTTQEHTAFMNRGDRFEGHALPVESQLAPAFHAGIADFDGDGAEDVFLSQNFFGTEIAMPRHDAGTGLWLRGDGAGGLAAVPPSVSGIAVYGEQRGAAFSDFDGDGRVDLAVSQNGAETRVFRNRGAKPGVRVRLIGGPGNPHGYGSKVRLIYGTRRGPVREVQSGSGYWSVNGAIQVMGTAPGVTAVLVRWPGGEETQVAITETTREVTVRRLAATVKTTSP